MCECMNVRCIAVLCGLYRVTTEFSPSPSFHSVCRSKQRELYDETFQPIVEAVLQGYNGEG